MIRRLVELGAEKPTCILPRIKVEMISGHMPCKLVSLRRGLLGCIVHSCIFIRADTGETWEVPAFHTVFNGFVFDSMETDGLSTSPSVFDGAPAKVVFDPTGCGNTFCGGFLAGWL
ncbi:hypothetical protein O6H91_10G001600 [Diphasiastrum complanatum]|uniref:Uncharacterized protein n=1 Tax=Diphasiastrum complanatum TaxID=34168 RepID=A0ACC2CDN2_DIPCM|nr:hypothetical protein O6H91_10G001600 [Diphasiastrum complanatum]